MSVANRQQWRPIQKKQIVIGIRQRNGDLRFFHAHDVSGTGKVHPSNITNVDVIMTDELKPTV